MWHITKLSNQRTNQFKLFEKMDETYFFRMIFYVSCMMSKTVPCNITKLY